MNSLRNTIKDRLYIFVYAFLLGVILHAQALFLRTDATDSIRAYGGTQAQPASGRFIGYLLDGVFERLGFWQPYRFINVLFYLAFTAAGVLMLILIFGIRSRLISLLLASLVMSSAMNSGILIYFYVAHMYGFVFLLSMLSAWLLLKTRALLLPAALLVFSMGIYQAFLPTAVLVIFLYRLRELCGEEDVTAWLKRTAKDVYIVLASLLIYIALNRLFLRLSGLSMSGYAGMGENVLPGYGAAQLLRLIGKSYRLPFELMRGRRYFLGDHLPARLSIAVSCAALIAEFLLMLKTEAQPKKKALLGLLMLLLPVMINLPMFMEEEIGERLSLNWYFLLMTPLILADALLSSGTAAGFSASGADPIVSERVPLLRTALSAVPVTAAIVMSLYSGYRNVSIYSSYEKCHDIAENIVLDIEQRLGACEDFSLNDEILFMGTLHTEDVNQRFFNEEYGMFLYRLFNRDHASIMNRYAVHSYRFVMPDDARVRKLSLSEAAADAGAGGWFCVRGIHSGFPAIHSLNSEVLQMPSYPAAGCVRRVDGLIVVKLSD